MNFGKNITLSLYSYDRNGYSIKESIKLPAKIITYPLKKIANNRFKVTTDSGTYFLRLTSKDKLVITNHLSLIVYDAKSIFIQKDTFLLFHLEGLI